jgi:hypothetical protein
VWHLKSDEFIKKSSKWVSDYGTGIEEPKKYITTKNKEGEKMEDFLGAVEKIAKKYRTQLMFSIVIVTVIIAGYM